MQKLELLIKRSIQSYYWLYFGIAVGQMLLFSFMQSIGLTFFIVALLWLTMLVFVADKLPHKRAVIVFSVLGILFKWIWIVFVPTPATSDYKLMLNTAREILTGSREYLNNVYYQRFPYQMGFTVYQAAMLTLLNSVTFLKLVNTLWCAIASLAVYGITREAFHRDVARLALLLHVTFLPILVLSSVLTNQHIAVAWLYIGIYLWMKYGSRTWWGAILAGTALAIGAMMRPIGIVVIIAIVVNELLKLLLKQDWKAIIKRILPKLATTVIVYQVVLMLAGLLLAQSGLSPDGLKNNDPLWKFMVGLNAATNGGHSRSDELLLNYGNMDVDERNALEKHYIVERLTNPVNMVKLPFVKIGKFWADFQPTWFTFPDKAGTYFNYLGWTVSFDEALDRYRSFERAVFYLLAILAFYGVLKSVRTSFSNEQQRLLILIMGAYTFIHLFVEVQSRYLYFLFFVIVAFAAWSLLNLKERLYHVLSSRKN